MQFGVEFVQEFAALPAYLAVRSDHFGCGFSVAALTQAVETRAWVAPRHHEASTGLFHERLTLDLACFLIAPLGAQCIGQ